MLAIIGLIIGGVLVGQDLIRAAEVRAQISQIEKYNTGVETFYGKYGPLPGDMTPTAATQFGFAVGTSCDGSQPGWRNGDGMIEGWPGSTNVQAAGETGLFWMDLSSTVAGHLIDGTFGSSAIACVGGGAPNLSLTAGSNYLGNFFPPAKLGLGNFLYVYSVDGANWWGLSAVVSVDGNGVMTSNANIPVLQARAIDKKVDDGMPTPGSVVAVYIEGSYLLGDAPNAASDSPATCYNTTNNSYSIGVNSGAGANCALSFRFQ